MLSEFLTFNIIFGIICIAKDECKVKKYKPKKWFTYTRLIFVFMVIFALGRTTDHVYEVIQSPNQNEQKALDVAVIEDNKEDIYVEENSTLAKYLSVPERGFVVTEGNRKYELSESDYNLLVAVISSESNKQRDDILAVTSIILNRSDGSGKSPVEVVSAPNQFTGYLAGHYLRYMNEDGSLTANTALVQEVVSDALNGIRNNSYYSFRSWNSYSYSDNYIVEFGNRFN